VLHFSTKLQQQQLSKCWGRFSRGILFFEDIATPHKAAIMHQIFTLKFWNTLIWPICTITFFLISRNTLREEGFQALSRPH
jgi:hypothetical protein